MNNIQFDLPFVNASLNFLSTLLLICGWRAIRKKNIQHHKKLMISAFCTSAIFLASYLYYHFTQGHFKFTGEGLTRTIYFIILVPHILLAMIMVPMILITFLYAFRGQFVSHRKIARFTLPIWLYVSFTGVLLYVYIYILFPGQLKKQDAEPNKTLVEETL
jgi:putative membrane protein